MEVARHPAARRQLTSTHKPVSKWLPSQRPGIQQWLACKLCEARERTDLSLDSSLVAFKEVVNSDPTWEALSNDMFAQWSKNYDTGAEAALESLDDFIEVLNIIVQSPSSFFDRHGPPAAMSMIAFPINAALDWPMGTLAGYEFWLIPAINASFRNVLNTWTCFLRSSASQAGLKNWLYQDTLGMIAQVENGGHTGSPFHQIFVCDPTAPYYGFGTWDGFFRKPGNGLHPGL